MKVLIGYDGSECSDAALADLSRAGLPQDTEALVLSAPDVWPTLPPSVYTEQPTDPDAPLSVRRARALAAQALEEARKSAQQAAQQLRSQFPQMKVEERTSTEPPQAALIKIAEEWPADLIIVGSHGQSGFRKLLLGSVSQSVLTHAPCSVRISRCHDGNSAPADAPVRLLIGIDGSENAAGGVRAVASRHWPRGSIAHLVTAMDLRNVAALVDQDDQGGDWAEQIFKSASEQLRSSDLIITTAARQGDPKHVLLKEAESSKADCIFLGAKGMSRIERLLLGSVSSAIAAQAPCSVEVVRPK